VKQCFWLNLLNFMTLYRLAEIKLTKPEALKVLTNYTMWQAFMKCNTICIQGVTLTQFDIYHSVLRQKQKLPQFSFFYQQRKSKNALDERISKLVVNEPMQFLACGLYLPIKKMPFLQIFKKKTL